jgi:hypothetical protein
MNVLPPVTSPVEMKVLPLPPAELDKQSPVKVDEWLDIESEKCKDKDPDLSLTKKWMKMGFESGFLFLDSLGRVWGVGNRKVFYPFHFNIGKVIYGFRIAKKAAN